MSDGRGFFIDIPSFDFSFRMSLRLRLISWKFIEMDPSRSFGDNEVWIDFLDFFDIFESGLTFSLTLNSCSYFVILPYLDFVGEQDP